MLNLRTLALTTALLVTDNAHAVIVVDYGIIDTDRQHYVIDENVSTVTYDVNYNRIANGDTTVESEYVAIPVGGSFDVDITRYWRNYFQDGDYEGTNGLFSDSITRISFSNPAISLTGLDTFALPASAIDFTSDTGFEYDSWFYHDWTIPPKPPLNFSSHGMICFCFEAFSFPNEEQKLLGVIQNGMVSLDGNYSSWSKLTPDYYGYHIEAAVVPLPGAVWLFGTALAIIVTNNRRNIDHA